MATATYNGSNVTNTASGATVTWNSRLTVTTTEYPSYVSVTYTGIFYVHGSAAPYLVANRMTASLAVGGTTVKSYTGPSAKTTYKGATTVVSYTTSYNKTASAQSKACSFSITVGSYSSWHGTSTASGSVSIPALASYSISYNENGATSGSVASQTKYYGIDLTLQSNEYSRSGYTFSAWNTNATGTGTTYSSGGTYSANAAATLYAQWSANQYAVTFNANSGTGGTITSMTRTYNSPFTVPATAIPTRTNYNFLGWASSDTATAPEFVHTNITSGTCTISSYNTTIGDVTLYAVWELAYTAPTISNFDTYRVSSATSSAETNEGQYIYVAFDYRGGTANLGASWIAPSYVIEIDGDPVASGTLTIDSNGRGSFPASTVAYGGAYSTTMKHTVVVTLNDSYGVDTIETGVISTAIYPLDIVGSGSNVYMGVRTPAVIGQELTLPDETYINGAKIGSSTVLINLLYPVGSYYETSDTSFNPNTAWSGTTWVLETEGQVHVSAGTNYAISGALSNTTDGGSTDAIIPYHNHSVPAVANAITGGSHTHPVLYRNNGVKSGSYDRLGEAGDNKGSRPNAATATTHTHNLPAHDTDYVGTDGNTVNANMQPYIIVNRWHRTA